MDWNLGAEPTGASLLAMLREICGPVAIIVMSGMLDASRQALAAGADYFLGKPFGPERLITAVAEQLGLPPM
jgi:CheY-like chemotaxis protein